MNRRHILLFGLPRSGTTWVGKVFDSHPDTLYLHEPDRGGVLNGIPLLASTLRGAAEVELLARFVAGLPATGDLRVIGKLPVFRKNYYSSAANLLRRCWLPAAKAVNRIAGRELGAAPPVRPRGDTLFVVWKSIESLGRIGAIAERLGDRKAVHLIRHPCGYAASVLRGEAGGRFAQQTPASEDYGIFALLLQTEQARRRGLELESMRRLQPVERLAWRWVLYNEKAMEELAQMGFGPPVRYEDLCADPGGGFKTLLETAGLAWDRQVEEFVCRSTTAERRDYYSVYKDPRKAAQAWQVDLSAREIDRILGVVADSAPGRLYAN